MRNASRIAAASFGFIAGIAGLEHGYFEILQGNTRPASLMFASMGPPCVAAKVWDACEPAVSILPNFLITGILTLIIGLVIMAWSAGFVQRKNGGCILILLSVILILFGGGVFPPLFGVIGGVAGIQVNKPLTGRSRSAASVLRFAARLWPWPLVIFMIWALGQFPVGYFFNNFLQSIMGTVLLLAVIMSPLSLFAAYAYDFQSFLRGK